MANRYGKDIGRRGGEYSGSGDYGRGSTGSGSRPFGDDERYFGGSRQYGEGYSGRSYNDFSPSQDRDYDDYGSRSGSDYEERGSLEEYRRDRGRYSQGNESSQGWGGGYRSIGRQGRSYDSDYTGGGYSGRGYSGGGGISGGGRSGRYYGPPRMEDRWGGHGGEDVGRYHSDYGSGYQSSERGYTGAYNDDEDRGWWEKTSDEVASWFGDEEAARRRRMDARGGGHRGRGPSGYTRSDERIKEDINDRLTDYDYLDATNISVEVSGGDVTLTGTVDSRYEKRLAEDLAEDVSGVRNVENRLRVSSGGTSSSGISSTTSTGMSGTGSTLGNSAATGTSSAGGATETTTGSTASSTGSTSRARGKSAGS